MTNSVSTGMMKMTDDTLAHYGVLGMKWGKRKNKSSFKAADKQRKKAMKRDVRKRRVLSDADLKKKLERIKMEKQLKDLTADEIAPGKRYVKDILATSGKRVVPVLLGGATLYAVKYALTKEFDAKDLAGYMTPKPKK